MITVTMITVTMITVNGCGTLSAAKVKLLVYMHNNLGGIKNYAIQTTSYSSSQKSSHSVCIPFHLAFKC